MSGVSEGSRVVGQRATTAPSVLPAFLSDCYNIVEVFSQKNCSVLHVVSELLFYSFYYPALLRATKPMQAEPQMASVSVIAVSKTERQ